MQLNNRILNIWMVNDFGLLNSDDEPTSLMHEIFSTSSRNGQRFIEKTKNKKPSKSIYFPWPACLSVQSDDHLSISAGAVQG